MMRRVLSTIAAAAAIALTATIAPTAASQAAATSTSTVGWYVCKGSGYTATPVKAWGRANAPTIGYLPARSQIRAYAFGDGSYARIVGGTFHLQYVGTANLCTTASTGVADRWAARADTGLARALQLVDGTQPPVVDSRIAQTIALRSPLGWNDPQALEHLNRALATQQKDGGFGLDYPVDAFGDGTVNDEHTAYTVTIATHLGDAVLLGYEAGVVDADVVKAMVAKLQSIATVPGQPDCIAYSDNPNDARPGYCIHNVSLAAGVFLIRAARAGFDVDVDRAWRIVAAEMSSFNPATGTRLYMTGNPLKPEDADHAAFSLDTMHMVAAEFARPKITDAMSRPLGNRSGEAHTVLASIDCAGSAAWLSEHDQRALLFRDNLDRQAYLAWNAAKAAAGCR